MMPLAMALRVPTGRGLAMLGAVPQAALAAQARREPPRLGALAALLAVALDLAAHVLGDHVDRVEHLGRGLAGAQRHALEVERRLGDLAVGDRGVALLAELDLELAPSSETWRPIRAKRFST